jgi:uncharacterized protein with GYD domain
MSIYISRGRFTSDAIKGMLAKAEDREEAVAKLFKSVGGRLIGWYLTFGHHDWLAIGEFPDEKAAASAILAAAAGGSLSDSERCCGHFQICRKGGEGVPERRALVGFRRRRCCLDTACTRRYCPVAVDQARRVGQKIAHRNGMVGRRSR